MKRNINNTQKIKLRRIYIEIFYKKKKIVTLLNYEDRDPKVVRWWIADTEVWCTWHHLTPYLGSHADQWSDSFLRRSHVDITNKLCHKYTTLCFILKKKKN